MQYLHQLLKEFAYCKKKQGPFGKTLCCHLSNTEFQFKYCFHTKYSAPLTGSFFLKKARHNN